MEFVSQGLRKWAGLVAWNRNRLNYFWTMWTFVYSLFAAGVKFAYRRIDSANQIRILKGWDVWTRRIKHELNIIISNDLELKYESQERAPVNWTSFCALFFLSQIPKL